VGCFLDLVDALACVGTAVALFPVVRRQNEAIALGSPWSVDAAGDDSVWLRRRR
jgi:hypothetical protein